ncbi:MAG: hypothetical protein U9N45_04710, partial [Gemmatimonadota bacterium]|nr:hypothetical protein [Gemmatimonadota bacterium]
PDYGYCHHFVRIRGMINPLPYPVGNVSKQPSTCWCGTDIEPLGASFQLNQPEGSITPPGIWGLSSYWLEMNSWQGEGGTSFYPNLFEPASIKQVDRDRWVCVEVMVKMNSSPDSTDGEEAVWIDGRLVSHLGPGTLSGYWKRDKYYIDELQGEPFEGFRWRRSLTLKWNRLWLLHYVSETVFKSADEYAAQ